MPSPYEGLQERAFWRTGVAETSPSTVVDLYRKRFDITPSHRITTAGSCFAQHIARHLRQRRFNVLDVEPSPPHLGAKAPLFGYSMYSARYGNIYTARQLRQLLEEAFEERPIEFPIWSRGARFFDALRPSVEPHGLPTEEDVQLHREQHLARVRSLFQQTDIFVFTLGLTEAWLSETGNTVYPTASGTIADAPSTDAIRFHNFTFLETLADMQWVRDTLRAINKDMKFLVTVSPVPLTATASGHHVLPATVYSKSVLRAVVGELYTAFDDIDYFPSYELIASPFSRGAYFEQNLRSVRSAGVHAVMRAFFMEHAAQDDNGAHDVPHPTPSARKLDKTAKGSSDVVCEEALLEAFAR